MKLSIALFCLLFFTISTTAQTPEQVLAIANGQKLAVKDLPEEIRLQFENLPTLMAEQRKNLLDNQIINTIAEIEAASLKITIEELYEKEVRAKVPNPSEQEIQRVYELNRPKLGNKTLAEVRPQIIEVLRAEPEKKVFADFINLLKAKYRPTFVKDINTAGLKPTDVLVTIGTKNITYQDFDLRNKITLYETRARVYDAVKYGLNQIIFTTLVMAEAKMLGIESSDLLAREITDKLRDYTDEERDRLETAFRKRLLAKYKPQILLTEPAPLIYPVAVDGNPVKGAATATVTVVMFSDFQCGSCAQFHPIMQKVMAEFGAQVRLMVRDFPLTTIHKDAFNAALAAGAAHAQGKFFEYTEILYRNQNALDLVSLKKYATQAGLNLKQFELDLQSEKIAAEVRKDMNDARALSISGTPTIFINGVKLRSLSEDGFREAIERALKK